jgi:hypothetical protein
MLFKAYSSQSDRVDFFDDGLVTTPNPSSTDSANIAELFDCQCNRRAHAALAGSLQHLAAV